MAPDGQRVAYVEQQGTRADLKVDGRAVTQGQDVFLFTPEWSGADGILYTADGGIRTVVPSTGATSEVPFRAGRPADGPDLPEEGARLRRALTTSSLRGAHPQLSPDGRRVLFVALNDLWVMRIGDEPRRLTRDSYQEVNPVWSPDGKQIAYSSDRAGTEDIYVRDLRSGEQRRVTALPSAEVSASFSPDQESLAFQDEKGATYVLDLASGEVRELVTPLFGPGRPTWSADSATLAFASVRPVLAAVPGGREPDPRGRRRDRGPALTSSRVTATRRCPRAATTAPSGRPTAGSWRS